MRTLTSRTETRLAVHRPAAGSRARLEYSVDGGPDRPMIRPMVLSAAADKTVVSLVPEGALLLAGDAVSICIEVGDHAVLHLIEPAGIVAYDMRGGASSWDVTIELGDHACLVWHGEPFVAAAGSATRWRTRARVGTHARLALRETIVLGRHGEVPGRIAHSLLVDDAAAQPVLADGVDLGPGRTGITLGGHRVMSTMLLIGATLDTAAVLREEARRYDLESGAVLVRALADQAHLATDDLTWQSIVAAADHQPTLAICSCTSNCMPRAAAR